MAIRYREGWGLDAVRKLTFLQHVTLIQIGIELQRFPQNECFSIRLYLDLMLRESSMTTVRILRRKVNGTIRGFERYSFSLCTLNPPEIENESLRKVRTILELNLPHLLRPKSHILWESRIT